MTAPFRLAMAALGPWPGALRRNAEALLAARRQAAGAGAALLLAPQGALAGHPLLDLARDGGFREACTAALAELAAATGDGGPALLAGAPEWAGGVVRDTTYLLAEGRILARRARHAVPERDGAFTPGPAPGPVSFQGVRLGIMTGADLADPSVAETLAESGAELLLCAGAEPFLPGREERVLDLAVARVVESGLPLAWVNAHGLQEEAFCPGGGFVLNADRSLALRLAEGPGGFALAEWREGAGGWHCAPQPLPPRPLREDALWAALVEAIADRVAQGGHAGVLVAPGPAAALLSRCSVEALGEARVRGPSREPPLPAQGDGLLLLHGLHRTALLLGEDMPPSGFAPLKGLYATEVATLAAARALPAPAASAETDAVLRALAEGGLSPAEAAARGLAPQAVAQALWRRMRQGGYKQRHAAPGLDFGHGPNRRYPLRHWLP